MAGVTIDIPGIGNVEAKNAATEATLREILKAMQGVQKNTGGSAAGAGGGGGGAAAAGGGGGGGAGKDVGFLGKAANAVGQTMGKLSSKVMPVIGGFQALNGFLTGTIDKFANVGDSVEKAAATIPILGGLFSTVASAAVKVNDAFLDASKSGATFGGSVSNLAASASSAGMTMDKFASLVSKNGQGMLGFGSTTEEGAKRFAQVSKSLRETSGDLYALGYSTEDINGGLAKYGELLRAQGLQGKKSNSELVDGAKKYMKELDQLAKITGEERSVKEAEMKKLAGDAQFQAAMAGKSEEVRASFMKTVTSLPGPLQGFVKDFLATGTLTSEETQRIGAMMGGDVMNELQNMRNKMQSGTALTAQEQDRLAAIMKAAGEKQLKATGSALAASRDMDGATAAMAAAATLQTDAHKNAAKEQGKAAKEGDGFNKKMQEMQQTLAKFSNYFQMVLANSGVLDLMMKMFTGLATLVQTFVVPAFNIFTAVVTSLGNFLIGVIQPVFATIGSFIKDQLYPAFLDLAAFIIVDVLPPLQQLGNTIMEYVTPILESMGQIISEYVMPVWTAISDFVRDNLQPIMIGLAAGIGTVVAAYLVKNAVIIAATVAQTAYNLATMAGAAAMALLTSPIFLVVAGITAMVALFTALYKNGWEFKTVLEAVKDNMYKFFVLNLKELWVKIMSSLPKMFGGYSDEEKKAAEEALAQERQELEDRAKARDARREEVKKERENSEDAKKRAEVAKNLDKKIMDGKNKFATGVGKTADKVEEANKTIDTNAGPEALLKQFAASEGSALVPPKEAAAKADATKKEIEAKGQEKQAAEDKAKKEAEEKKAAEEKAKESEKKQGGGQESAETLLAQLNTNMSQLIKISQEQKDIGERQLTVQRSLTKDLYAAV